MRNATISAILAAFATFTIASADCPDPGWQAGFGAAGVSSNQFAPQVNALQVWDPDGPGGPLDEVLVVGGAFITAGGVSVIEGNPVGNITVWDGETFRGRLPGLNSQVLCMCVDEDNVLVIGGHFTSTVNGTPGSHNRVAWWNGISWQTYGAGANASVYACVPGNSGDGRVYFGGDFTEFDGEPSQYIALAPNDSYQAPTIIGPVRSLINQAFEIGSSVDVLIAGVSHTNNLLYKWDLHFFPEWLPLIAGGPVNGAVFALERSYSGFYYAGGSFQSVANPNGPPLTSPRLVQFSPHDLPNTCRAMPTPDGAVHAILAENDNHQGPRRVYIGGRFSSVEGVPANNVCMIEYESPDLDSPYTVIPLGVGFDADVFALALYRGELYAGGSFGRLANGVIVAGIARWDGSEWRALGQGAYPAPGGPAITCVAEFQNQIVAAGRFTTIGGVAARRVARLTGEQWVQIGQGFEDYPHAMVELDDDLYALGMTESVQPANEYYRLQRFEPNGALWVDLGGFDQYFSEAAIWNGQLVVGGSFTASGATPLNRIAIRDGNGTWQQMGAGFNSVVTALTLFNGELIAGGYFTMSGSTPVTRVARWDGTAWQPMGSGLAGNGNAAAILHVHNGELYAGGDFYGYLSRWTGSTWVQVGDPAAFGGCFGGVNSLASYYGDLIVAGSFSCGQVGILRWNGVSYGPMAVGAQPVPNVANLVTIGGDLWMNGVFNSAGGLPASGIALWRDQTPWIVVEPAAVTANAGDDVTLTASTHSDGFPPIVTLQWFHNDQEIPGADLPTLTLSDVQPADAGEYRCSMDAFCDFAPVTVESNIVTVTVDGGGDPCPGDLNNDGTVSLQDLATLLSHYGTTSGALPDHGDIDGDGDVDLQDLANLLAHFGTTCP